MAVNQFFILFLCGRILTGLWAGLWTCRSWLGLCAVRDEPRHAGWPSLFWNDLTELEFRCVSRIPWCLKACYPVSFVMKYESVLSVSHSCTFYCDAVSHVASSKHTLFTPSVNVLMPGQRITRWKYQACGPTSGCGKPSFNCHAGDVYCLILRRLIQYIRVLNIRPLAVWCKETFIWREV